MGDAPGDETAECDDCMLTPRAWATGASVMTYDGLARRLVMALKHGDRQDLVGPFAAWMARRFRQDIGPDDIFVPVPIHWRRMIRRKFNQSALLANRLAKTTGATAIPDGLIRTAHTKPQEGLSFVDRFALQAGVIRPNHRKCNVLNGRRVIVVDDVMTSGATLASCTTALQSAGVDEVHTLTLARVVKDR